MALNGIKARLKASTADGGSRKLLAFGAVVIVAAIAYVMLSAPATVVAPSTTPTAPAIPTVQARAPVSPNYANALTAADEERREIAVQTGGSVVPTVTANPVAPLTPVTVLPDEPEEELPVVSQPRPPVIEARPTIVAQPAPSVPLVMPQAPVQDPQASQQLVQYMNTLRRPAAPASVERWAAIDEAAAAAAATAEQSAPAVPAGAAAEEGSRVELPLSGTILYAELVGRANSDSPGPVLAQILQGPYAGARLIGRFEAQRESLVLTFDRMTVGTTRDGEEINETVAVEAVAVDVTHIGTGLATSVDRHLFEKIAFGFGAAFAQGFGEAVSRSGSTTTFRSNGSFTTTNDRIDVEDQLLEAGGKAIGQTGGVLQQEFGNRPTTIIVDAGTPLGLLFL